MASLTFRPTGAGDLTGISGLTGAATHWEAVDEVVADDVTSSVNTSSSTGTDLYKWTPALQGGPINSVRVYYKQVCNTGATANVGAAIKTGGTVYYGTYAACTEATWTLRYHEWTTNPYTGRRWAWDEIYTIQFGVKLGASGGLSGYVTQVYVVVDYTAAEVIGTGACVSGFGVF